MRRASRSCGARTTWSSVCQTPKKSQVQSRSNKRRQRATHRWYITTERMRIVSPGHRVSSPCCAAVVGEIRGNAVALSKLEDRHCDVAGAQTMHALLATNGHVQNLKVFHVDDRSQITQKVGGQQEWNVPWNNLAPKNT